MKVLFWAEVFPPSHVGGVETLMRAMVPEWRRQGIHLAVVANHGLEPLPDEMLFEEATVHRFHFHRCLLQRNMAETTHIIRKIKELKKKEAPDLIHLHSCQPSLFFHLRSLDSTTCPILLTIHEEIGGTGKDNPLVEELVRTSTRVTCVSEALLNDLRTDIPASTQKSSLLRNALPFPASTGSLLDKSSSRMLFAGRLVRDKGLDVALKALALLHHRFPDLGLDIAGRGKEETDLKNLVRSLGLEANIRFLGQLDPSEMAQLYRQCSFVLIPSRWREPFGLVALEAAHHGKPVVASAVGGLSEIVFDQETGFLVEKENPQALAAAIGKLLENQGLRARMGDDARTRAQSEFSFDKFVSSYMLLYHELTKIPVFS